MYNVSFFLALVDLTVGQKLNVSSFQNKPYFNLINLREDTHKKSGLNHEEK